jgi:hAT family C-terminal dimerisation region
MALPNEGVLDYWNSRLLSQPDLAHSALDMLALPASSSECERVFSSARLLVMAGRNRLNPGIIEMNKCLNFEGLVCKRGGTGASEEPTLYGQGMCTGV